MSRLPLMGRKRMSIFKKSPGGVPAIILLLVALGTLAACGGGEPDVVVSGGRSLEIRVTPPEIKDRVAFIDDQGQHRVIEPNATNRQLVVINVTVANRSSTVIPLLIDDKAAQIGDREAQRIFALDAYEEAQVTSTADPEEGRYAPLLRGEVELPRDFQVSGWMVFDVPKGLRLGSFWWKEVDNVVLDYIEYRRR